MGRLGLLPDNVIRFFNKLKYLSNLKVEGILSHFAEADEGDNNFSRKQLSSFLKTIKIIRGLGFKPQLIHIANSAAIIGFTPSHFNLVRPGIVLYGVYPAKQLLGKIKLKPAMRLITQIVQIKNVTKGFPVSYGRRYVTKRKSIIAAIPIGYGDGYPYHLFGKGEVLVRGQRAKVIGTICMDITMIDVTNVRGARVGDEVVIIGKQGDDEISAEELAEKAGTIPYEILCSISSRVPRIYI
jgi:alanine racemase